MKKIFAISCALVAGEIFSTSTALAIEKTSTPTDEASVSPQSIVKSLSKGETFSQGNATYTVYPQLSASFGGDESNSEQKFESKGLARSDSAKHVVLKTKYFTIFKTDVTANKSFRSYASDVSTKREVVLNNATGKFGVLSGGIIVMTKETEEGGHLPLATSLQIKKSYPAQGFYIVESPQNSSLAATVNELAANPSVQKAVVEVIENFKVPM